MSYLARLKRLDGAKNFTHTPESVLTKPTQPGSVSCVSSIPAHIEKIHAANDGEKIATESTSTAAEPITDMPGNRLASFQADSDVDRNESLAAAMDDRRRCSQCLNLLGRACTIAKPERGALVLANLGYRPAPDTLQRCAGYLPNTTDCDQRPGGERWPGLTDTKGGK